MTHAAVLWSTHNVCLLRPALLSGDLAHRLQCDIDRLAAEHAAPSFQPHVTLLGGTEQSEEDALRISADLAQSMLVSSSIKPSE